MTNELYFWGDLDGWWFGLDEDKQGPFSTWDDLLVVWFAIKGIKSITKHERQTIKYKERANVKPTKTKNSSTHNT